MKVESQKMSVVRCPLSVAALRCAQRTTNHEPRTASRGMTQHVGEFLRNSRSQSRQPRFGETRLRGMTLIELLVVIVILTTIVGAAIPLMSPSNDDRRLREAARGLNTYIIGAQTRAIATKRPYGIALKRLSHDTKRAEDNGVCLEVFYVEQQPPYAGFDANSRACVAIHPSRPGLALVRFVTRVATGGTTTPGLPAGWAVDLFPPSTIRPHDVIEINGTRFELLPDITDTYANVTFDAVTKSFYEDRNNSRPVQILAQPINNSGQQINSRYDDDGYSLGPDREASAPAKPKWPYWAPPSPYKVIRQPTPASDEPYQLPEGAAIDLRASGVGSGDYFYVPGLNDNSEGVIIMFAPEGRVARVSYSQMPINSNEPDAFDKPVVDNIYLLVGRRENIPAPDATSSTADPSLSSSEWAKATTDEERDKLRKPLNWLGGSSRWVVIGSQTGRIATIENAFVDVPGVMANPQSPFASASQSTEEMRAAQILAAREFTREMAQVGGR
jgi:prepilin-type N-terminal cleavage/methylation domain-containing protein